MAHETFLGSIFRHGLKSKYLANILPFVSNMAKSVTGSGLTDAQKEANAFTANQAQKQMDFQQQMRDSQYQSAVTDMRMAGVNPAIMYGSGASGNVAPSGAMATSVGADTPDVVGLLGQIANLSLLKSQKKNIDADTTKKLADIDLTKQNIVESGSRIQQIQANVRKLGLESDAQDIVNKYLDRIQNVTLQNMTLQGDNLAAQWTETQQKIANLIQQEQKTLQDIAESKQRVDYLLSQTNLNNEQVKEVTATIAKINQETDNLVKTGKLTQKDIDYYFWNNVGAGASKTVGNIVTSVAKPFKAAKAAKAAKAVKGMTKSQFARWNGFKFVK